MNHLATAPTVDDRKKDTTPMPQLMTLEDVAKLMNVSKAWVRDHTSRRRPLIPVVRLGGRRAVLRFRPQDIERFINSNLLSAGDEGQ